MRRLRRLKELLGFAALLFAQPALLAAQTGLRGVVRDSAGRAVSGAEISIDALKKRTTSDDSGRYVLADLQEGTRMVAVRRVGFLPTGFVVPLKDREMTSRDFVLESTPVQLDTARVVAAETPVRRALAAFDEHRKLSVGRFMDSTELRQRDADRGADILHGITGVSVVTPPLCKPLSARLYNCVKFSQTKVAVTSGSCSMQVKLDQSILGTGGVILQTDTPSSIGGWATAFDLTTLPVSSIIAVEVYRREVDVPTDLRGSNQECGLIQFHTRR